MIQPYLKKWVCVLTLSAYAWTSFSPMSSYAGQTAFNPPVSQTFELPNTMGRIVETFDGTNPGKVIIIQDAHAVPSAQIKIAEIVEFMSTTYGVRRLAAEGASSTLDLSLLRAFPDPKALSTLMTQYRDDGYLSGLVWEVLFGNKNLSVQGIEDWKLYEEGIRRYLDASRESQVKERLQKIDEDLKRRQKEAWSSKLLETEKIWETFEAGQGSLAQTMRALAQIQSPKAGTDLALVYDELIRREEKARFFEPELRKAAEDLFRALQKDLSHDRGDFAQASRALHEKIQAFQTAEISSDAFGLFLESFSKEKQLGIVFSPGLLEWLEPKRKLNQLQGRKFFEELTRYVHEVLNSLCRTEQDRRILNETESFHLLKKWALLELSIADWREVSKRRAAQEPWFDSPDMESHTAFYQNAVSREDALFEKLRGMFTNVHAEADKIVLFVAGGFHADGMTQKLRDAGISYTLILPAINGLPEKNTYRSQMEGQVPWKDYFRPENGQIRIYDAFNRFMRDQLLKTQKRPIQETLKLWRDELIRTLSAESAKNYTVYLDELLWADEKSQAMEKVEGFIQQLTKLHDEKRMTPENVFSLLKASTALQWASGTAVAQPGTLMRFQVSESAPIRAESRSEQDSEDLIKNLQGKVFQGFSPELLKVEKGEIVTWEPDEKLPNISVARPHNTPQIKAAKIANEVAALRTIWRTERAKKAEGEKILQKIDLLIEEAVKIIETENMRGEAVLQRLGDDAQIKRLQKKEIAWAEGVSDNELTMIRGILEGQLIPAMENRNELFYLDREVAGLSPSETQKYFIERQKELLKIKAFDILLRGSSTFHSSAAAEKIQNDEGNLALARAMMMLGELLPKMFDLIDGGKSARFALKTCGEDIRRSVANLEKTIAASKAAGKDSSSLEHISEDLIEEVEILQEMGEEFNSYEFVYEPADTEERKNTLKTAELIRHREIMQIVKRDFPNELGEDFSSFVEEETRKGRPLSYAIAKFCSQSYKPELPRKDLWDALVLYSHTLRFGDPSVDVAQKDNPLIVVAKSIRHEMDYYEILSKFRRFGRVVALIAPKRTGEFRIPHWFIFAKKEGIISIPFLNLDSYGVTFQDIKRLSGQYALADGKTGRVVFLPSEATTAEWEKKSNVYRYLGSYYAHRSREPAEFSGEPFYFLSDESDPQVFMEESDGMGSAAFRSGSKGVGLLRIEELMMVLRHDKPGIEMDERMQLIALAEMMNQKFLLENPEMIVRLFDVAGDKRPQFLNLGKQYWGEMERILRDRSGTRFYLGEEFPEFRRFGKIQIKAIMGAYLLGSPRAGIKMLFSDIRHAEEIEEIELLVQEAKAEFLAELDRNPMILLASAMNKERIPQALDQIPIGYMFEDTITIEKEREAIFQAIDRVRQKRPAKRFIGIGSNDLTRTIIKHRLQGKGDVHQLHPQLIRDIWLVAADAKKWQMDVTLEGEWGNSRRMLFVLLALRHLEQIKIVPVAATSRIPELLEFVRSTTVKNIEEGDFLEYVLRSASDENPPLAQELDRAADQLVEVVNRKIINRYDFNDFITVAQAYDEQEQQERSEMREEEKNSTKETPRGVVLKLPTAEERKGVDETADRIISVLIKEGAPVNLKEAQEMVRRIEVISFNEFLIILRQLAQKWIQRIQEKYAEKTFHVMSVSREEAEAAIARMTRMLKGLNGSMILGFDTLSDGGMLSMTEASRRDTVRSAVGLLLVSKKMKGKISVKGVNLQFMDFANYRGNLAFSNSESVPVLTDDMGKQLPTSMFHVLFSGTADRHVGPFFDVVAQVARMTAGLLTANAVQKAGDLKDHEQQEKIRAELLTQFFHEQEAGFFVEFDPDGNVKVNLDKLVAFIRAEYRAAQAIARAA